MLGWLAQGPEPRADRLLRPLKKFLGRHHHRAKNVLERVGRAAQGLLQWKQSLPLLGWTFVYWAITTLQLLWFAQACGLPLGGAESATLVAILGLSILLPGGPAQAGTFQVGVALGLGLFVDTVALRTVGSQFVALLYAWGLMGTAIFALPGLLLLRRASVALPGVQHTSASP